MEVTPGLGVIYVISQDQRAGWCQVRLGQNRYDSKSLKTQNLFGARLQVRLEQEGQYTDMLDQVWLLIILMEVTPGIGVIYVISQDQRAVWCQVRLGLKRQNSILINFLKFSKTYCLYAHGKDAYFVSVFTLEFEVWFHTIYSSD